MDDGTKEFTRESVRGISSRISRLFFDCLEPFLMIEPFLSQ